MATSYSQKESEEEHKVADTQISKKVVDELFDAIETDVKSLLSEVAKNSEEITGAINTAQNQITIICSQSEALNVKARESSEVSALLSTTTSQLNEAAREIGVQINESVGLTNSASEAAAQTKASTAQLEESSNAIGNIVDMITQIAKQTNLLALNATIEATRAGEAGLGFAVVAKEVKTLAEQTRQATDSISREIEKLQADTQSSIQAIDTVVTSVENIRPVFAAVAAAVEQQNASFGELLRTSKISADFIAHVTESAQEIDTHAREAQVINNTVNATGQLIKKLMTRAIVVLRQNDIADRRRQDRLPHVLPLEITSHGRTYKRDTIDFGMGGLLFLPKAEDQFKGGDRLTIQISGCGTTDGIVKAISELGIHVEFTDLPEPVEKAIGDLVSHVTLEDSYKIDKAKQCSEAISQALERALNAGEITEHDLFDLTYMEIEGSNPVQYTTSSLALLERVLPGIQEPLLASEDKLAFCAAVDRNGYLPVHNKIYSQPQRADDPSWNMSNCRNRRIFDDRAGLAAAKNLLPHLVQAYPRDMGNGDVIMMKEIDVPIMVNGHHWGGFRTAYKI